MTQRWNWRATLRLATLLFPLAGLVLLWRSPVCSVGRKIFGTVGIILFIPVWAAGVVLLLHAVAGLEVEFRGGMVPRLTFSKTQPDFAALEANRAKQRTINAAASPSLTNSSQSVWNGFRGPRRNGICDEPIRITWPSDGLRPLWKQPVGGGYASFAIENGVAFTIEQRRQQEAIVAYELRSGRELWVNAWEAEFQESLGGDGPRATPSIESGLVYGLGALGEFRCIQATDGQTVWRRNIVDENQAEQLTYGMAASPLVVGNKVIVAAGGSPGKSVVAYDRLTGAPIWKSQNDEAAYSSPMLMEIHGTPHLIVVSEKRAMGLDPESGRLLWEFPWIVLQGNRNIAQPLQIGPNRIFLSAGYGTGCAALEIVKSGEKFSTRELWRNKNMKNKFTSSIFREGAIYGLDEDILACVDAQTGARNWKEGRYGYGQLLLASGQLVILCGDGDLALVAAKPDRAEELCRFPAIRGKTWNVPAIADGLLLVRNSAEMACFDLKKEFNNTAEPRSTQRSE
jgi:outer membrane protein assembly factor BamB